MTRHAIPADLAAWLPMPESSITTHLKRKAGGRVGGAALLAGEHGVAQRGRDTLRLVEPHLLRGEVVDIRLRLLARHDVATKKGETRIALRAHECLDEGADGGLVAGRANGERYLRNTSLACQRHVPHTLVGGGHLLCIGNGAVRIS